MKLRRPTPPLRGEPITALIDVVFFLLVFFMLIGRMDATSPFELAPPHARSGQDLPAGGLTLAVDADGALALDGTSIPRDALAPALGRALARDPALRLRINAHHSAELRHLLPLITEAESAGVPDIMLVVTPPMPRDPAEPSGAGAKPMTPARQSQPVLLSAPPPGQPARGLARWGAGLIGALLANAALLALVVVALRPDAPVKQPSPQSRLDLAAHPLPRSEAAQSPPDAQPLDAQTDQGQALSSGAIIQQSAQIATPATAPAQAAPPQAAALPAAVAAPPQIPQALPRSSPLVPASPQTQEPLGATDTTIEPLAPATAIAANSAPLVRPDTTPLPRIAATPTDLPQASAAPAQAAPVAARGQSLRADFAFPSSTSETSDVDPQSLAAFQQLLDPAGDGAPLRDGIEAMLAALPCARVQLSFDPDSATLELRGHVPSDDQRAPVLAALQAQMGPDIALSDRMRLLPAPQCGALAGIADVGLPQSTDQATNPLLIGADAQARVLDYRGGDALYFDLTAPDYPAYVYVDYFDAGGSVLHLLPNEAVALRQLPAKSPLRVGTAADDPADAAGLRLTVGPPYGQEIAVAFAASHALFSDAAPRPLQEPAAPYLARLKQAVTQARAAHDDFKGEWVYFLIVTRPQ